MNNTIYFKLIETDEGSHYLGEVALVPFKSPISDTNIVFYNTLYDENASCHFAIGSAYRTCIQNGNDIKDEELDKYRDITLPQYKTRIVDAKAKSYEQFKEDLLSKLKASIESVSEQIDTLNTSLTRYLAVILN